MGGKGGIDALLAVGEQTESVAATKAIASSSDLVDARPLLEVGDALVDNGVRRVGPVLERELSRVEARLVEVERRRLAIEHVWGDNQETRAGERVS